MDKKDKARHNGAEATLQEEQIRTDRTNQEDKEILVEENGKEDVPAQEAPATGDTENEEVMEVETEKSKNTPADNAINFTHE